MPSPTLLNVLTPSTFRLSALSILYTLYLSSHISSNHYTLHTIRGPSMAPSLSPSYSESGARDVVLFRTGSGNVRRMLKRGSVVCFWSPGGEEGRLAVKRVVGVEGDEVRIIRREGCVSGGGGAGAEAGKRAVDGKEVLGEDDEDVITVPYGHVWVEGDQVDRSKTFDSNDYGPISKSLITGVAVRILWPRERARELDLQAGQEDGKRDGKWEERVGERVKRREGRFRVPELWREFDRFGVEVLEVE